MATLEEIRRKAKTAAFAATLSSLSVAQAQEIGSAFSEKDALRMEMKTDAQKADVICENPATYLDVQDTARQKMLNQLHSPVKEEDRIIPLDQTTIGPFPGYVVEEDFGEKRKIYKSDTKDYPTKMERETRIVNTVSDLSPYNNLAYFNPDDTQIYMPKWVLSDEMKEKIADVLNDKPSWQTKLMFSDTAAEIAVINHEAAHSSHHMRGQTNREILESQTADMYVEKDYVTEKVAYSVQYLTLANLWKQCKDAGIETLHDEGKTMPIGDIMSQVPELRKMVEENGFDPKSEQSVAGIVSLACQHWDKDYKEAYGAGQFQDVAELGSSDNIMNQIVSAREQQKIFYDMTKNLHIGGGVRVDIPDECFDMLMPQKEFTQSVTKDQYFSPSTEGLLAIDHYLDSIGIDNDKDKDAYIKQHYEKIVNRSKDADLKLKELMLGCCNKKNNMIYYTDMLQVKETNGIQTISGELGVFAFNKMDERGDNLTGSKEKSAIKEEKGATKKLSIGEISSALYQNMSR